VIAVLSYRPLFDDDELFVSSLVFGTVKFVCFGMVLEFLWIFVLGDDPMSVPPRRFLMRACGEWVFFMLKAGLSPHYRFLLLASFVIVFVLSLVFLICTGKFGSLFDPSRGVRPPAVSLKDMLVLCTFVVVYYAVVVPGWYKDYYPPGKESRNPGRRIKRPAQKYKSGE
jgi:hypothetical protein